MKPKWISIRIKWTKNTAKKGQNKNGSKWVKKSIQNEGKMDQKETSRWL